MGFENVRTVTLPIGAAIASNRFVTADASGEAVVGPLNSNAIGVSLEGVTTAQYDSGDGQITIPVGLLNASGKMRIESGAAVSAGDSISSDATGRAVTSPAGSPILGTALEAAGGAGEMITVLVQKGASPNTVVLTLPLFDVSTGTSDYLVSPIAGEISRVRTVVTTALTIAAEPALVTLELATVLVVGSNTVIAAEAAVGDTDDSGAITPGASTTVAAGDAIEVTNDGVPTSGVATVIVEITPA
jgi:hypothetical protein